MARPPAIAPTTLRIDRVMIWRGTGPEAVATCITIESTKKPASSGSAICPSRAGNASRNTMNEQLITIEIIPAAIVTEAALSWLGLGDPTVPTWGRMLYLAHYYGVMKEWWWIVFPGLCIALVSIAFIFVGYAMDEVLNPKLRRR